MSVALLVPIQLNGTGAIVTDPCYYDGTEYAQNKIGNIKQGGEWKMETHRQDFNDWGVRTVELAVVHSTFSPSDSKFLEASAGVDSGQMSICGDLDAPRFENPDEYGPDGFDAEGHRGNFDYQGACDLTLNTPDRAGVLCDVMAVSESGFGDGCYGVYVWRDSDGLATKISVDFNPEDEEEEEEEEQDDEDEDEES